MSKRKNISKQDLKNLDLVLENDVQCSGLNIGGRAYEFVSGGYELLDLGSEQSGTLTDAQLLDLMTNDSIIIKIYTTYFRKVGETTTNITYEALTYDTDTTKYVNSINITKSTKQWKLTLWKLQNQPLTISDVNAKLNVIRQKAQIINDVLYVSFRATAINEVSANETLFVISTDYKTTYNKYFNYYRDSGVLSSLTLVVAQGSYNTNITVTSGNTIDIELSILL